MQNFGVVLALFHRDTGCHAPKVKNTTAPTSRKLKPMRIDKKNIPVKFAAPGAIARQRTDFGDATGFATIGGEYFSLGAGADLAPLLQGLEDDACQAPHWGYVISGDLAVTYTDGTADACIGGDLFYWPPGHSVRVTDDAEVVMFSPQHEHTPVLEHIVAMMGQS